MRRFLIFLLTLFAVPVLAQQTVPEIPFDSVPEPLKLPPEMNFGEVVSVALNAKGHLFVISHSNISGPAYNPIAMQLLEFDEKGNYVREIGKGVYGFAYGHMVRIDRDQNIWVVDKGTNLIMRFNPAGHITMVLGRRDEVPDEHEWISTRLVREGKVTPPPAVPGIFQQPTDIAWDREGNMYVTDGYINSRVDKYTKEGDWITSWGTRGTGPGQFNTPHNIQIDNQDRLYVADRGNARIQVFDTNGEFLRMIKIDVPVPPDAKLLFGFTPPTPPTTGSFAPGAPWALCITPGPTQYMYAVDTFPGRLYKMALNGKVLGVYGKSGRQLGEFAWPHGLACPSENLLWVADNANWRVQKLVLRPGAGHAAALR
jgi:sugar lactone lactonase YvrE